MRALFSTALLVSLSAWTIGAQRVATTTVVTVSGELRQWHKVTLTIDGPQGDESSDAPSPFLDYRLTVTFTHESGSPSYRVPGYFAADGNAGETSATSGNKWRAHFSPDKTGRWNWRVGFVAGKGIAIDASRAGVPAPYDGQTGEITIGDKGSSCSTKRSHRSALKSRRLRRAGRQERDHADRTGAIALQTMRVAIRKSL